METGILFFSQRDDFFQVLLSMLRCHVSKEILISGTWDNTTYKKMIENVLTNNHADKMRMIISNVLNRGVLSRQLIDKILERGGKVNVNSSFNTNLIIVDENVFIASYSCKYSSGLGDRNIFECCMFTSNESTVNEIRELFDDKWSKSFSLSLENDQGDMV